MIPETLRPRTKTFCLELIRMYFITHIGVGEQCADHLPLSVQRMPSVQNSFVIVCLPRKHCYGLFPDIRALKVEAT